MTSRRLLLGALSVAIIIIVALVVLSSGSQAGPDARPKVVVLGPHAPPLSETVSVGAAEPAPAVAPGFLGLSIEYQSIALDTGTPQAPNRVLDGLVSNLAPGQRPVVRIGGDSTDHTWWPVPGRGRLGLSFDLTPAWINDVAGFARRTNAQLLLGIDLEMSAPRLAGVEARHLLSGIGAGHILGWEVGNEPSNYPVFPWYETVPHDPSTRVYVRSQSYSPLQYLHEFAATAADLPRALPLIGPALGSAVWMNVAEPRMITNPRVRMITLHSYPLTCFAGKGTPIFPSVANLLSTNASDALAGGDAPYAAQARAAGRTFRVDELNSVSCGGTAGISDTFASALWITDTLFAMARAGITGVNIQDFNAGRYKPWAVYEKHGRWLAHVYPIYYGMLLFERAAPAGSRLLTVNTEGANSVRAWAAQTPVSSSAHGARTVTLLNVNTTATQTVRVQVPGARRGSLLRVQAAGGATARQGVTFGGLSYPTATASANLPGSLDTATLRAGAGGVVTLSLPPASAALLSLSR